MNIYSIILAAGEGKRMKSNTAKPLQRVCGKTLIDYVLSAAEGVSSVRNVVVVGHKAEDVKKHLGDRVSYAYQYEQLGTGHAVMQGITQIPENDGIIIALCGDTPLITAEDLKKAIDEHISGERAATVVSAVCDNPRGYGRIVREDGEFKRIVEEKDANEFEKQICEINSGMCIFNTDKLKSALKELKNNNSQGEYYLTDTFEILASKGEKIGATIIDFENTLGVNDRIQLAQAEKICNQRQILKAMQNGVTVINPDNTYISAEAIIGEDTVIYPGTYIEGKSIIGSFCTIGPDSTVRNSTVGNGSTVERSVIVESKVGSNTNVGPFAYMRPNSSVGDNVKIGDFVEIKNSSIDNGTKVAHLTYIGDADVGKRVNFGCGTVVVNYDGISKHRTTIGDDAFIGCNSNLVSPVKINDGAYTAAGSTITDEVPKDALAIARSRQVIKEDWVKHNRQK